MTVSQAEQGLQLRPPGLSLSTDEPDVEVCLSMPVDDDKQLPFALPAHQQPQAEVQLIPGQANLPSPGYAAISLCSLSTRCTASAAVGSHWG